jgi:hypothetical protein
VREKNKKNKNKERERKKEKAYCPKMVVLSWLENPNHT